MNRNFVTGFIIIKPVAHVKGISGLFLFDLQSANSGCPYTYHWAVVFVRIGDRVASLRCYSRVVSEGTKAR
jgi:hypothetical protein